MPAISVHGTPAGAFLVRGQVPNSPTDDFDVVDNGVDRLL